MSDLQAAIENLYTAFARHPKPASIESCPCGCTKPEEIAPLLARPLRELPADALLNYAFSAMTTQGSPSDFQYFLPRLFEAVTQDLDGLNAEILFGKLKYAKWKTWPTDETDAIENYLTALWETAVSSYPLHDRIPPFFEIEMPLACIARTGESLHLYLKHWSQTHLLEADKNLIQLVTSFGQSFSAGESLRDAFWQDCLTQGRELREWILRPETMDRIERSAHLLKEDGYEHLFEPAMNVLRHESATQSRARAHSG